MVGVPGGGTRRSTRGTSPRRRSRTRTRAAVYTTSSARPRKPSGCSCSSDGGVYRLDDAGKAGPVSAAAGSRLTSASRSMVDPDDPDSAYVIPPVADGEHCVTPDVACASMRRATGLFLGAARRRPPGDARLPDRAAAGVRPDRKRRGARTVLRRHLRRYLRLGRRGRHLVDGRDAPAAGVLRRCRLARFVRRGASREPAWSVALVQRSMGLIVSADGKRGGYLGGPRRDRGAVVGIEPG